MNLLRGLLIENMGLKLVALVLALVVYLHVYTERPASMTVVFPVEAVDLADSLAVVSQTPATVAAEIKGTGKKLIRLRLAEPRLHVSLAGVGAGRFQRSLRVEDLPVIGIRNLEVARFIGPQMLEMEIDRVIVREVPVAPRVEEHLPSGWTWSGRWVAEPGWVKVRGPRSVVSPLDSVRLAIVRIESGRDTVRTVVGPSNTPPGCEVTPDLVTLRLPVERVRR